MSRSAKSAARSGTVLASARHVLGGDLMRGARADLKMASRGFRWGRGQLVPRSAEPYVVTKPKPVFPTAWARTPAINIVREGVQRFGLGPLLRSEVQPIVHGLDLLQRMGPRAVVFVANHSSHMDTPLILCSLPDNWRRRTAVAAAADYFFDTWWRATGSAVAFNTFPIERRGGTLSSTPGDLLGSGWNVVVFPEGTRSPDGWTRPFRLGAAYLAAQYGVPVVPIGIRGSYAAMPRGRGWPVPGRPPVTVRFGEPIQQREGEGVRELGARIETAVAELVDEDASTWWESKQRSAAGQTPATAGPDVAQWRRVWASTESPRGERPTKIWHR
jgi:1-acyl-sn-glycerol-3-phosphate acyltransferase